MLAVSKPAWAKWLNEHSTRKVYDENPDRVALLCTGATPIEKFHKLVGNKNLVLLTRAQLGEKLQATFCHSVVGIPIIPDQLHYVARSGMQLGVGIEVEPTSLFEQTPAKKAPTVLSMMKVTSTADIAALTPTTAGRGSKIDCFVYSPLL